jgi:pilus assembly protein Flp/PilA
MNSVKRVLLNRAKARELGQGLVEYGFILAAVALVAVAALFALGPKISAFYTSVGNSLP